MPKFNISKVLYVHNAGGFMRLETQGNDLKELITNGYLYELDNEGDQDGFLRLDKILESDHPWKALIKTELEKVVYSA